jgi:mRNA interferase MazF
VVRLELATALPDPFPQKVWWAKCDMIATVAFERLDLFRSGRDANGRRRYFEPRIFEHQFDEVRQGILNGLGFVNLTFSVR